jgi:hypothetical protein
MRRAVFAVMPLVVCFGGTLIAQAETPVKLIAFGRPTKAIKWQVVGNYDVLQRERGFRVAGVGSTYTFTPVDQLDDKPFALRVEMRLAVVGGASPNATCSAFTVQSKDRSGVLLLDAGKPSSLAYEDTLFGVPRHKGRVVGRAIEFFVVGKRFVLEIRRTEERGKLEWLIDGKPVSDIPLDPPDSKLVSFTIGPHRGEIHVFSAEIDRN